MTKKNVTLINGQTLNNVDLTRWAGDPNFYKVLDRSTEKEILVNVSQIAAIKDHVESSLSDLPPVQTN